MNQRPLHYMLIPALIVVAIYQYLPMYGIVISFQKFVPAKGLFGDQTWVGLENFRYVMSLPGFWDVIMNTLTISSMKIVLGIIVPVTVALLLNEMGKAFFKRSIQTLIYLPHFLSWVIVGGILINVLSPGSGIVNRALNELGFASIFFLGDNDWFPVTVVLSNEWKDFGWSTIIYLAALTGIDQTLYEAAKVDGANRWKQTWHITLPGISHIVVLLTLLSLGRVLNAGFDQIFNLYSPAVYESGDIIDTFVYRLGLEQAQFSVAAAVGLFKSAVSFILISVSYYLAFRITRYRIF